MKRIAMVYHSVDFDGMGSAAIFRKYSEENNIEADFIGFNYGDEIPDLSKYDKVIMSDISLPVYIMKELYIRLGSDFIFIDHHISAIKASVEHGYDLCEGIRDVNFSGCELTWKYFFPYCDIPKTIKLLGDYDVWRNNDLERWNKSIMPFQFGLRLISNDFNTFPKYIFDESCIDGIIEKGNIILEFQKKFFESQCIKSFEAKIGDYNAICLNLHGIGSTSFDSVYNENKHDIMVAFQFDGKKWYFSLYTTKDNVDCSVIAKSFGGGGHRKAAGMEVEDFKTVICLK